MDFMSCCSIANPAWWFLEIKHRPSRRARWWAMRGSANEGTNAIGRRRTPDASLSRPIWGWPFFIASIVDSYPGRMRSLGIRICFRSPSPAICFDPEQSACFRRRPSAFHFMKILVLFFTFALSLNPAFSQSPPAAPAAGKTQLIAHFHALRRNFGNANTAKVEMLSGPEAVKMLRGQSPGKAWQARLGGSKFKITIEDKLDMKLEQTFERLQRLPAEYRRALEVVSEDKKDGVAFYADLDGAAAHGSQNYLNLVKGAGVEVISHEAGHVLEQRATRADPTVLERWNKARTEDGVSISAYGDRVNHEDLAEFAMLYAICLDAGKERLAEAKEKSPRRFAIWQEILTKTKS